MSSDTELLEHLYDRFNGNVVFDKMGGHIFRIEDGLIRRFDIR